MFSYVSKKMFTFSAHFRYSGFVNASSKKILNSVEKKFCVMEFDRQLQILYFTLYSLCEVDNCFQ